MRLRLIIRHVESLSVQSALNQNRLHAAHSSISTRGCIVQDLNRSVALWGSASVDYGAKR